MSQNAFANAGIVRTETTLNASIVAKLQMPTERTEPMSTQDKTKPVICLPIVHECFDSAIGDTGDYSHCDRIKDAKGEFLAELWDSGNEESCEQFTLIVRAVNSHSQLVDALKAIEEAWVRLKPHVWETSFFEKDYEHSDYTRAVMALARAIEKVNSPTNAALALANGADDDKTKV